MTYPEPVAPTPAPQLPVENADGSIPNVNPGTPEGTIVVGPGQPNEPVAPPAPAGTLDRDGLSQLRYVGEEPVTLGTLRLTKGDTVDISNASAKRILSGDNGSNYEVV